MSSNNSKKNNSDLRSHPPPPKSKTNKQHQQTQQQQKEKRKQNPNNRQGKSETQDVEQKKNKGVANKKPAPRLEPPGAGRTKNVQVNPKNGKPKPKVKPKNINKSPLNVDDEMRMKHPPDLNYILKDENFRVTFRLFCFENDQVDNYLFLEAIQAFSSLERKRHKQLGQFIKKRFNLKTLSSKVKQKINAIKSPKDHDVFDDAFDEVIEYFKNLHKKFILTTARKKEDLTLILKRLRKNRKNPVFHLVNWADPKISYRNLLRYDKDNDVYRDISCLGDLTLDDVFTIAFWTIRFRAFCHSNLQHKNLQFLEAVQHLKTLKNGRALLQKRASLGRFIFKNFVQSEQVAISKELKESIKGNMNKVDWNNNGEFYENAQSAVRSYLKAKVLPSFNKAGKFISDFDAKKYSELDLTEYKHSLEYKNAEFREKKSKKFIEDRNKIFKKDNNVEFMFKNGKRNDRTNNQSGKEEQERKLPFRDDQMDYYKKF